MQLRDLIPVETPLGRGYAIIVELCAHDNWWTVALQNGAIVTFSQDRIRICKSYTHGRGVSDKRMRKVVRLASERS